MSRRRRKLGRAAALAALGPATVCAAAMPAFPGAQGFGANATGGRTGDVYHVSSLADTNTAGTLRFGLNNAPAGGRTIVFDIGGSIVLGSDLSVSKSNITIAGQTAPGPGITIINTPAASNTLHAYYKFQVTSSSSTVQDNIVRYLTVRRGYDTSAATTDDAVGILGSGLTKNIILDHVTASWGSDENLSPTDNSTNVTVQNCYITEALNPNDHAYGTLVRPKINSSMSFNHNLWSSNLSRNPRIGNYNGTLLQFDFRNNVIYNWGDRASYTGGASEPKQENTDANYVANYFIAGPSTPAGSKSTTGFTLQTNADPVYVRMYQSVNKIDSNHNAVRDGTDTGWGMFVEANGSTVPFPTDSAFGKQMTSPFAWAGNDYVATDTADDAYAKVLAAGGGSLPGTRNAVDTRIVASVRNNTGAIINAPDSAEWSNLYTAVSVSRPAGFDTDGDGMPDAWESSRGTNPIVDDHTITGPNGYNNLENYLNDLTLQATWNTNADGIWSTRLNWLGNRPTDADATAYFGNVISAPRTITADMPASVGQLVFDSSFGYTLAGASAITMDVISGSAAISVMSGSHIVSAPLSLTHATSINVAPAGSTLTITNLQPTTVDVAKNGSGTLVINSAPAGALAINSGKVKIANPGGGASVSKVGTLSVANFATLDLTKNSLITTSDIGSWNGSAYTGVTGSVQRGRNGGGWSGAGIITSETAATVSHLTTLAVAQAADVLHVGLAETGTWFGQSVSGSDTLIMYTYAGDFDLNGVVNADDYFVIDSNYNKPAPSLNYARGDLNYDGRIDGDDYAGIDASFTAQTSVFPHAQAVPEPSTAVVLVGAAAMSLRRRRRC